MRLTKKDLASIPAKTPGLMTRVCGDPFVRMITDQKPHTFFRRQPHMRNHSVAVIIDQLLKGGHDSVRDPEAVEAEAAYAKAAKEIYQDDGTLEFDKGDKVSLSLDGGAYVQGWRWIMATEANRCDGPDCHADLGDGEGYDGKCGNCADKEESLPQVTCTNA